MFRNYILVAARHFRRTPFFTAVNVVGLAIGIAVCTLIALFVLDELRYDQHHENGDRIVRVVETRLADGQERDQASTPPRLASALLEDAPVVQQASRFYPLGNATLGNGDEKISVPMMLLADSTVFDVFTLPLLSGDAGSALTQPNSLVLKASVARSLFGEQDPIGRIVTVNGDQEFTVTGVMVDPPRHSHLDMSVLGSFQTLHAFETEERLSNWIWQQFYTYVRLTRSDALDDLELSLDAIETTRANPAVADWGFQHDFHVQPLGEIYLGSSGLFFDAGPRGSGDRVRMFALIGVLILIIASFNFMNLSTARSAIRAREVGLRKVVGARRGQLIRQFLGESTLLALAGLVGAAGLIAAAAGFFESFTGKPFAAAPGDVTLLAGGAAFVVLVVGVLAGLYPALYLSSFRPAAVLRGTLGRGRGAASLRRVLVVTQFAIAVALIAGTGIVRKQLDFIQQTDLGYDRDLLVTIQLAGGIYDRPGVFEEQLRSHPAIVEATSSYGAPSTFTAGDGVRIPEREDRWGVRMMIVEPNFLDVYNMEMMAGRAFDPDRPTDIQEAFILNETAAAEIAASPEQALGQRMTWEVWNKNDAVKEGTVIGVVRDFYYDSIHSPVSAMVLHAGSDFISHVTVRLAPGRVSEGIEAIEQTWAEFVPDEPARFEFVDDALAGEYEAERRLAQLNALFTLLAVIVAGLGLLALSSFVVERRAREIGVRKVLGASSGHIAGLVTGEFLKLVAAAFVVGAPVSWFAARRWLDGFSTHVDIGIGFFIVVGMLTVGIALLSVGSQALRAAGLDPVANLKDS